MTWRPQLQLDCWYTYGWNRMGRKGQRCVVQVLSRTMNSVQVQFEDGHQAITSQNALRPDKKQKPCNEVSLF